MSDGPSDDTDPVNQATLDLIKRNEGCVLHAYADAGGVWTIGYGHTGADVHEGMAISQNDADLMLERDLRKFEAAVDDLLTVGGTDNEYGAMVSLAFNIGVGDPDDPATHGFANSSILRHHNAGETQQAADAFLLYDKAAGRVMQGLVRRRTEERALYLTPDSLRS